MKCICRNVTTNICLDTDEDDLDSDEDMMADEATDNDDEYDEDIDESEQEDEDTWNRLSTPQFKNGVDFTTTTSTTPKTSDSGSSTPSLIDPYFTHFDPRSEHQSYKVNCKQTT